MGKKKRYLLEKTGVISVLSLLVGAGIVLFVVAITSKRIYVLPKEVPATTKSKTYHNNPKKSRYLIINNYYANNKRVQTRQYSDTLIDNIENKFYTKATNYSNVNNIILDINTVDTFDLQQLRGIGPAYARRIYKYRQRLGGFVCIEQLKEVFGMTDSLYNSLFAHFSLTNNNIRKININTNDIKKLYHPYIDHYLAKSILEFTARYGYFKNIEDLKKVHLMDDSTFNKVRPYLTIN